MEGISIPVNSGSFMRISAYAIVRRLVAMPCASLLLLWSANAAAAQRQVLVDHVPKAVAHFKLEPVDRLQGTNRLSFVVGLPFRNRPALTNLVDQLYDSKSPSFHHWLTPHQFNERFSPTREDYEAVAAFVKMNGLKVVRTHPDRVLLDVEASVADIERVFHVTMRVYQHPLEKRTFFAPDAEPSFDLDVPVLHITGMDNYVVPHPDLRAAPIDKTATPKTGSGPGNSYIGSDFRKAYAQGVSLTGSGQVVGLLELDGYNASDITSYVTQAGQAAVTLQDVLLDGDDGAAGTANDEVCLDIEMAIAMAPGLSQVTIYEAPNHTGFWIDILAEMANPTQGEPLANQLSSSWLIGNNSSANQYYQQFNTQGQSFFQCSGDDGAYYPGLASQWADSPYITIVGGTVLTTDAGGAWVSETTWNDGYDPQAGHYWASGGGISQNYAIPSWQQGINMITNQGSTTMRNVPDVSMVAKSVFITCNNGGSKKTGGTSAAAPLWAGFLALINQQAVNNGQGSIGFINPAIYSTGNSSALHDIADNSDNGNGTAQYFACSGYDLCTGLGTPNGGDLIDAFAAPSDYICTNNNGILTIIGYNGAGGNVTIPGTINSRSVTSIGTQAFFQCSSLTSVTIPSSVTNIGSMAFAQCSGLTSVTIPASVISIGNQAFSPCSSLTTITVDASNAVYSSASGVLFNKAKTMLIQYPGGKSGSYTIPATVTTIGNLAFSRCNALASVIIPASVTSIGTQAFYRCNGLNAITVNTSNTVYSSVSGILFDNSQTTLIQYPGGKSGSYTMPASVTTIGDWAFSACNNLTGIYFRGDAPGVGGTNLFVGDSATVYYLPGTTGWGSKYYGLKSLLWNPQVTGTNFGVSNKKFGFTIVGTSNIVVVVQACTNLTNPTWVPVGTNTLNGGSSSFTDAKWTNYLNRFYRSSFP